jgi:hypothetical protein
LRLIKDLKIYGEHLMLEAIKPLIDSGIVNEDTKRAIQEAWEVKLSEARDAAKAELREEFARRYEHDKSVMVEALDKMVTESLKAELVEFAEEKRKLAEDRVAFKQHVSETGRKFNQFLTNKLAEEIVELRSDRKTQMEAIEKLNKFVIRQLAEEIKDFGQDKKELAETKVKLLANAQATLESVQKNMIKRSAALIKESVATNLKAELKQFKTDIKEARENMFGRRIFEAFASEFAVTHLNENAEIKKLRSVLEAKEKVIAEAKAEAEEKAKLVESKNTEIKMITESVSRQKTVDELCTTLTKDKANLMRELLENVQTPKLKSAFDKYLPAVLNNAKPSQVASGKSVLAESRVEHTGDKTATAVEINDNNVVDIKRLAGLK